MANLVLSIRNSKLRATSMRKASVELCLIRNAVQSSKMRLSKKQSSSQAIFQGWYLALVSGLQIRLDLRQKSRNQLLMNCGNSFQGCWHRVGIAASCKALTNKAIWHLQLNLLQKSLEQTNQSQTSLDLNSEVGPSSLTRAKTFRTNSLICWPS